MCGARRSPPLFLPASHSRHDTAVFLGLQKALLEAGSIKFDFLKAHAEGWHGRGGKR